MDDFDIRPGLTYIGKQTESFREKPTFDVARNIWLHCQREGLLVPPDVNNFFINLLTDDNDRWLYRIERQFEKEMETLSFNQWIVELRDSGLTYNEIAIYINDFLDDAYHTENSIRMRYRKTV